jgi:hypothetical protein
MKNKKSKSQDSSEVSNVRVSKAKGKDNFEFLCCAIGDEVPDSVDLIDDDAPGYESPTDIILEEIVM